MEQSFWQQRWDVNRIGFHSAEVHPHLVAHIDKLTGATPRRILVPLCGKSVDLAWLASGGHQVVGVEFVERAVRAFFAENNLATTDSTTPSGSLVVSAGGVAIICADILTLQPADVGAIDAIWDRAALVALPEHTRGAYVATLRRLLAPSSWARVLINAFDYDPAVMTGPPFSVLEDEVRTHYAGASIELLERADVVDRIAFEGHRYWNSSAYLADLTVSSQST